MSENLCRAVAVTLAEPSAMTFQVTKWFSKILQTLTSQQDASSQPIYSNQYIFECLGEQNVVCLLIDMLRFYLSMGDHMYLAAIYDTLKLLNLLCKMSPARSEQATQDGNAVEPLKGLIFYIESQGEQIKRNKRIKLLNSALQIIQELAAASFSTRQSLLANQIPSVLLQLFQNSTTSKRQSSGNVHSFSLAQ